MRSLIELLRLEFGENDFRADKAADWRYLIGYSVLGAIVGIYLLVLILVGDASAEEILYLPGSYIRTLFFLALPWSFVVLLMPLFYIMIFVRPDSITKTYFRLLKVRYGRPAFLLSIPIILLAVPTMGGAFNQYKLWLPDIQPFSWDPFLAEMDRILHAGRHPWEWLQPILGKPEITVVINWLYIAWFVPLKVLVVWQCLAYRNNRLRLQFFTTNILCWILLGTILAYGLSSAGPCFYGAVTGLDDPYEELMRYQRETVDPVYTLYSLRAMSVIWDAYQTGEVVTFAGISAMPSMHVAIACLFALLGGRIHPWIGAITWVYLFIILIGSVHTGWHYALDGYLGIIGTLAIWHVTRLVIDRFVDRQTLNEC